MQDSRIACFFHLVFMSRSFTYFTHKFLAKNLTDFFYTYSKYKLVCRYIRGPPVLTLGEDKTTKYIYLQNNFYDLRRRPRRKVLQPGGSAAPRTQRRLQLAVEWSGLAGAPSLGHVRVTNVKTLLRLRDMLSTTIGVGMTIFHFVFISWIFTYLTHRFLAKTLTDFYT